MNDIETIALPQTEGQLQWQNYWTQAESPGGIKFDNVRNTDPSVVAQRADALDKMHAVVVGAGDETLKQFGTEVSYEKMASDIVEHTEDLAQKADVARVWVGQMVAEGNYGSAVNALSAKGVEKTNIPEMHNPQFVGDLYEKAQAKSDFEAHMIAKTVADMERDNELNQLFKGDQVEGKYKDSWEARERTIFEKGVANTLKVAEGASGENSEVFSSVRYAHDAWQFRSDGYMNQEGNIHPLAVDTARTYVRMLGDRGASLEWQYQEAVESGLPQIDLEKLEEKMPKIDQLKIRLKRHFTNLSNKN